MRDVAKAGTVGQPGSGQPAVTPAGIALRWEWRTFARRIPLPPGTLAGSVESATPSTETYIISSQSPHNVKIRGGRFEMKRLERVNESGLELWNPVITVTLPADASALAPAWKAWTVEAPATRQPLTLEDIERKIVARTPWLECVSITKRRVPLSLPECRGEFVELQVVGDRWESVAIEGEAPDRVRDAIRRLGLESYENMNYPTGLARILGGLIENPSEQQGVV